VIRNADWIIDLGPEGGEGGGRIVAQGTPEQVARNKKSYTGQALANYFAKDRLSAEAKEFFQSSPGELRSSQKGFYEGTLRSLARKG